MARKFPTQTYKIICSLKSESSVAAVTEKFFPHTWILEEGEYLVGGCNDTTEGADDLSPQDIKKKDFYDLWNKLIKSSIVLQLIKNDILVLNPKAVNSAVLPYTMEMPYMSTIEFIEAVLMLSKSLGKVEIFNLEPIKVSMYNCLYVYTHFILSFNYVTLTIYMLYVSIIQMCCY